MKLLLTLEQKREHAEKEKDNNPDGEKEIPHGKADEERDEKQRLLEDKNSKEKKKKAKAQEFKYEKLELCDENFAHLPKHEKVRPYLLFKGMKEFSQCNLVLKLKNTNMTQVMAIQD